MIKKITKPTSNTGTKVIMNGETYTFQMNVPDNIVIDIDNDTITYGGKAIKSVKRVKQQTPSEWLESIKATNGYKRYIYHPEDRASYVAQQMPTYIQID